MTLRFRDIKEDMNSAGLVDAEIFLQDDDGLEIPIESSEVLNGSIWIILPSVIDYLVEKGMVTEIKS